MRWLRSMFHFFTYLGFAERLDRDYERWLKRQR
jgi:hypothetical protein